MMQEKVYGRHGHAAGQPVQWPGGTVTVLASYDADGRIMGIGYTWGAWEPYYYDARNLRVKRGYTRFQFYGLGGELLGEYVTEPGFTRPTRWLERVYFAGACVGEVDSYGGWRLPSVDRLGSLKQGSRRYPFGDGNESYANDEYATYRKDTASAHYYAWNRYYSATWGRFSSPDPYVMSGGLTNPQGWNRYSYVANDPVNYYDPRGLASDIPVFKVTAYCHGCLASAPDNSFGLGWALGFYMDLGMQTVESDMGWPGGGFGGAVPAPHEAATAIRDEVEAGRMTDCEGLAAFAKYAGQYYAGTTEEFVHSFGVFVDSGHPVVKVVNFLTGGAIASSPYPVSYKPFGESGFKSQYKDSLNRSLKNGQIK
jgi:RHS repeat-associated protein